MPYPPPPVVPRPPDPWLIRADIRLRKPMPEDVPALTAAVQPFDIRRFTLMPDPYLASDAVGFVTAVAGEGETAFLIVDTGSDEIVGAVGLMVDWREWVGEIGYWLRPERRGQGIMSDAVRELCRYGFEDMGLARIQLRAATNNLASNAIAERVGFTREGTARLGHIDGRTGDPTQPRVDMALWGLLPGELR